MDPKIVKKTQDTLGKAIKKPPLTEKLLNKPPFRFLHDIITEVIKNTGVLKGLYSEGELNSANVTDKEAKMNFLQKAIDCVGIVLGEPLSVRPSKIVAGHEPEKTNEFLHQLGRICLKKSDTTDCVKKVIAGEKPSVKKKLSSSKKDESKESKEKGGKDESGKSGRSRDKKEEQTDKDMKKEGGKSDEKESQRKDKDRDKDKERKLKESSGSTKNKEERRDERKGSSKEKDGSKDRVSSKDREGSSKERDGSKDRVSSKDREGSSKDRNGFKDRVSSKDRDGSSKDRELRNKDGRSKERERSSKDRDGKTREGSSKDRESGSKEHTGSSKDREDRRSKDDIPKDHKKQDAEGSGKERQGSSKERHGSGKEKGDGSGKEKGEKERMVNKDQDEEDDTEALPDEGSKSLQRPASAKGQRRRPGLEDESQEKDESSELKNQTVETTQNDNRKMSAMKRPSSARPAPPRIKKQEVSEEPQVRVNSGKAVAPVIVDKKDDDDDDTFIVEEDPALQDMLEVKSSESNPDFINTAEHGSLVRKMLESKKEADTRQTSAKHEEKPFLSDATRKKEREMAEKEIERLRNSIQLLVRSAHPLGKIMDYVQEDIDSMQKELNVWREENEKHEQALKAEQNITDNEIAPLRSHLTDIEQEIGETIDNISVVKSNIIRNEEKIEELIFGVSRS